MAHRNLNAIDPAAQRCSKRETLKSKCQNELRSMQREKLAGDARSEHSGGGVGLNEILRKADGRVDIISKTKLE